MPVETVSTDERLLGVVHVPDRDAVVPLAILIHGAASDCFDGLIWRTAQMLAESGIICATVNLSARGLGRYAGSLREFSGWAWASTEDMVTEVEEFSTRCAELYGAFPALIGHSWGAFLATVLASRTDCSQLSLVSPVVSGESIVAALFADRPHASDDATSFVQSDRGQELVYTGRINLPFLSASTMLDLRDQPRLAMITTAVQQKLHVVVGGREHESVLSVAREIVEQQPTRRMLTTIAGAGHFYRGRERILVEALAAAVHQG